LGGAWSPPVLPFMTSIAVLLVPKSRSSATSPLPSPLKSPRMAPVWLVSAPGVVGAVQFALV
jgi:hypothetical protein